MYILLILLLLGYRLNCQVYRSVVLSDIGLYVYLTTNILNFNIVVISWI